MHFHEAPLSLREKRLLVPFTSLHGQEFKIYQYQVELLWRTPEVTMGSCNLGLQVYHGITKYQVGRDFKSHLVQPILAKVWSRHDGPELCPTDSWKHPTLGNPPVAWGAYSNACFFSLWNISFLWPIVISPRVTYSHYPSFFSTWLLLKGSLYLLCSHPVNTGTWWPSSLSLLFSNCLSTRTQVWVDANLWYSPGLCFLRCKILHLSFIRFLFPCSFNLSSMVALPKCPLPLSVWYHHNISSGYPWSHHSDHLWGYWKALGPIFSAFMLIPHIPAPQYWCSNHWPVKCSSLAASLCTHSGPEPSVWSWFHYWVLGAFWCTEIQ